MKTGLVYHALLLFDDGQRFAAGPVACKNCTSARLQLCSQVHILVLLTSAPLAVFVNTASSRRGYVLCVVFTHDPWLNYGDVTCLSWASQTWLCFLLLHQGLTIT